MRVVGEGISWVLSKVKEEVRGGWESETTADLGADRVARGENPWKGNRGREGRAERLGSSTQGRGGGTDGPQGRPSLG